MLPKAVMKEAWGLWLGGWEREVTACLKEKGIVRCSKTRNTQILPVTASVHRQSLS